MHPRFSSPHALFQHIYQYLRRSSNLAAGAAGAVAAAALAAAGQAGRLGQVVRRDVRLALGGIAVVGVIVAAVAAGVSAGGGPAVDTADHVAAAAQQHAAHQTAHAKAAAAQHADKPAPSQPTPAKDHGAAKHGGVNHGAANHGASKHASAAKHGAASHGASNHGASNHGASSHGASSHGASSHGASSHGASNHGASKHASAKHHAAQPKAARHHSAPKRPYMIYDSVTPSAMAGHKHVATYATGNYAASPSQVAGHKSVMWIDVTGYDHAASVLDVEPGDASPSLAGSWAWHRLHEHPRALARIYTMRSMWPAVQAAVAKLPASMRSHVRYWIADPTGTPHIVPGADATQWYWGSSYDISSATPRF